MTVSKAIKALIHLKSTIPDTEQDENVWLIQSRSFIKSFFGEDSHEYRFINNFKFNDSIKRPSEFWIDTSKMYDPNPDRIKIDYKLSVSTFLDNCIQTIKINGLYTKPEQRILNILFSSKNWYLTSFFIGVIYFAGILTATINNSEKKANLSPDRIVITSDSIPNKKTNTKPKTTDTDSIKK